MIGNIGAYAIAFVVLVIIELPLAPITMALAPAFRSIKWGWPIAIAAFDAIKMCVAVLLAAWLIGLIGQSPSWLMYLIPGYLMVQNSIMRIRRVNDGLSRIRLALERNGKLESYDQRLDLWTERAHLIGDVTGWVIGTNLILQSATLV